MSDSSYWLYLAPPAPDPHRAVIRQGLAALALPQVPARVRGRDARTLA